MTHGRMSGVFSILCAFFAYQAQAKQFPSVPGEYVVKLKATASVSMKRQSLEQSLGGTVKQTVSRELGLILVKRSMVETTDSAVNSLAQSPFVEYAEPNFIYKVNGGVSALPNDPELGRLWGMVNTGQSVVGDSGTIQGKAGIDLDMARAWQVETGSSEITVAVIDTGVNYNEPDLVENIYNNTAEINGKPGIDDDNNGCVDDFHGCNFVGKNGDPMDVFGHGTHVSGTIGAKANDNYGVVGVAWHVKILPVRFLGDDGSGNLADAVSAIEYSTKMKVNIMSNSWGGGGFSQALLDAITHAQQAGILFVAAAGNDSNDNDSSPEYPASYTLDNILTVAAVDPAGQLAAFSNFGKTSVHVAAPGVDILSHTMKGLESWSGTSMATPHVAGVAALLMAQDKTQSYLTIKTRIIKSARPIGSIRGRTVGGLANAYFALTNQTAPSDPDDPYNWTRQAQTVSTDHPYANATKKEWTLTVPGAKRVSVYFTKFETEANYDRVTFKDASGKVIGTMSGKQGEIYSPIVTGDTVTVSFTSDDSVNAYGFDIGGVAYQ